jgi:hypothetical protein
VNVICPYCKQPARQVSGIVVYPHRPDLEPKKFYFCAPCDAAVGCHPDGRALGRLANQELRQMKRLAHGVFDPLWDTMQAQRLAYPGENAKNGRLRQLMRKRAYEWLAAQMGLKFDDCHIAMFDEAQCTRAIEIIRAASVDAGVIRRWAKERRAAA